MTSRDQVVIGTGGLATLVTALKDDGYTVIGPTARDGAIVLAEIDSADDFPRGLVDVQDGGSYRLNPEGEAWFSATLGPDSAKRFLHKPRQRLWRSERSADGVAIHPEPVDEGRIAFIGLRACDLAAIAVQDRVFIDGPYPDTHYRARRANALIVAVNCTRSAATCFCASMGTGPEVRTGHDLALTGTGDGTMFVAAAATPAGERLLAALGGRAARTDELEEARAGVESAAASQVRAINTDGLAALLGTRAEHRQWDDEAARCLNCANCTMVCPTCFCTTVEDVSALDGASAERVQRWDSCFTGSFSYMHGGSVRPSGRARYRQWLTHKLSTWHDQFGMSGCVGCGRCITWCPVGIDITAEAAALRGAS